MPRSTLFLLLLCACASRLSDDEGDDDTTSDITTTTSDATTTGTDLSSTGASSTAIDDSSGTSTDTSTTGGPPPPTGFFHTDIQPIFDEHCVMGCHEPGGQWGTFLDLSGDAYARIVGAASPQFMDLDFIEPGDPNASYLWHKINGTQVAAGGSGVMMPSPRPGMEATIVRPEQFSALEAWILAGAPQ